MMDKIMGMIASALLISFTLIMAGSKLTKNKLDFKDKKTITYYILFSVYLFISYMITDNFIRIIINYLILTHIYSRIYNMSIVKTFTVSFITVVYIFIAEIIFDITVVTILKFDVEDIQKTYFVSLFANITIAIIILLLTKIKKLNNFCYKLISNSNIESYKIFILFILLSLTALALLLYYIYFEINLIWSLLLCIFLITIFVAITLSLYNERVQNVKLKSEYDILLDNLSDYEKMYSLQRMQNHENKNDLLIIRGMIDNKSKSAIDYIDSITNISKNQRQNWMEHLKKIPEGGLRGILYYKLLEMENDGINIEFLTSSKYSIKSYSNLSEPIKAKICKLLGIYIDNAIQAVKETKEKNICINIDENKEYIIFKVANNFSSNIDLDRLYDKGYTTKGKGHGYGLSIAKEIIEIEEKLSNKINVVKDKFIQEITIKK